MESRVFDTLQVFPRDLTLPVVIIWLCVAYLRLALYGRRKYLDTATCMEYG
jgi:hypothetical protein